MELDEVIDAELAEINDGKMDYFHAGIDCSSWSVLSSLSGGKKCLGGLEKN